MIIVFIIGYLAIAAEHPLKLDKAASALLTGGLCWTIYILQSSDTHIVNEQLLHHLGDIASIVFFLLGAMTIVELIDGHDGFDIISDRMTTTSKRKLLIIITVITFFLSALLDNLTTAIVMTSLCTRLIKEKKDRLYFAGAIVISANAGGAWSPLGDVTTTMLWIGGQITALNVIVKLIVPSIAVCVIPTLILANRFKGQKIDTMSIDMVTGKDQRSGRYMLIMGIIMLLFVPVFKSVTHLPPFIGMLIALGIIWVFTLFLHSREYLEKEKHMSVARALQKIDSPSILFFLGILLAVSALQSAGILKGVADFLTEHLRNDYLIGITLGLLSAVVDNVPLVAAAQGMYDLDIYGTDHFFWEFLALTTGTGGSAIIIGSAAGVAVMGIEKIDFIWYLKKISWLALLGFAAGILTYMLQETLFYVSF